MIMENSEIRNKWNLSRVPDNAVGETGQIEQRQILKEVKCYTRHLKVTSRQPFAFGAFWSDSVWQGRDLNEASISKWSMGKRTECRLDGKERHWKESRSSCSGLTACGRKIEMRTEFLTSHRKTWLNSRRDRDERGQKSRSSSMVLVSNHFLLVPMTPYGSWRKEPCSGVEETM